MQTKTCTKCGSTHPATLEYFPANKRLHLALSSWCRVCHRAKTREDQRRRRQAELNADLNPDPLPAVYCTETRLPNGSRRIRFGSGYRPAHDAQGTARTYGVASTQDWAL